MIAADTDVLIDYLAGRDPAASVLAAAITDGRLATTAVNRFELLAGARTARQQRTMLTLLNAMIVWPLDSAAADRAAAVRRQLERTGTPIGMADSLVAGIVLTRDGALYTRNGRHFGRVDGLQRVRQP